MPKGRVTGGSKTPQKTRSMAKMKKELDKVVSLYVRHLAASKHKGVMSCYTCNKPLTIKTAQCGHFISRTYLATRWELNNLRCQCPGCNLFGGGKPLDFEENLIEEIGDVAVEEMKKRRHTIVKLSPDDYRKKIEHFSGLLGALMK